MNIQWNKVTWYSKTLALALFVALPICAFYYGETYGKAVEVASQPIPPSAPTVQAAELPAYYSSPAEWQTDAESTGGFSIAYPIDFDVQDQARASAAQSTGWSMDTSSGELGAVYFTLTVPRDFEPQTNFAGSQAHGWREWQPRSDFWLHNAEQQQWNSINFSCSHQRRAIHSFQFFGCGRGKLLPDHQLPRCPQRQVLRS